NSATSVPSNTASVVPSREVRFGKQTTCHTRTYVISPISCGEAGGQAGVQPGQPVVVCPMRQAKSRLGCAVGGHANLGRSPGCGPRGDVEAPRPQRANPDDPRGSRARAAAPRARAPGPDDPAAGRDGNGQGLARPDDPRGQ